jgi:magnesium chelatase subunit I
VDQERNHFPEEEKIRLPVFMKEIVAEISRQARRHHEIDQSSGVSVRVSIDNQECVIANSYRRCLKLRENYAVPRITDLAYIAASTTGKIEIEGFMDNQEDGVIPGLVNNAVLEIFNSLFYDYNFARFLKNFQDSSGIIVSENISSTEYERQAKRLKGFDELTKRLKVGNIEEMASALEFILEGLHLRGKLGKEKFEGKLRYERPN